VDPKWGKSDAIKFWRDHSGGAGEGAKILTFFYEEYYASFWSLQLHEFPQNLTGVCESMSACIVL